MPGSNVAAYTSLAWDEPPVYREVSIPRSARRIVAASELASLDVDADVWTGTAWQPVLRVTERLPPEPEGAQAAATLALEAARHGDWEAVERHGREAAAVARALAQGRDFEVVVYFGTGTIGFTPECRVALRPRWGAPDFKPVSP